MSERSFWFLYAISGAVVLVLILVVAASKPDPWIAEEACRASGGGADYRTVTCGKSCTKRIYRCDYRFFRSILELP